MSCTTQDGIKQNRKIKHYKDSCYLLHTTKTKGHNIVDVIIRAHTN